MKLYCSKYIRVCKEINIDFMPLEAQVSTCMEKVLFMCHSFLLTRHFINCFNCSCSFRCSHVIIQKLSKAFTVPRVKTNRRHWRNWQTNSLHSVQHWTSTQGSDIRSKPRQLSNQVYVRCINLIVIFIWTFFYFVSQLETATWRIQRSLQK